MAKKDLSKLSLEELVATNSELGERRDKALADVKADQLEIQAEISKRNLQERARNFTDEEIAELADFRKNNPQTPEEPEVSEDNG